MLLSRARRAAASKIFWKKGLTYRYGICYISIKQGARRSATPPERGWGCANYHYVTYLRIHRNREDKKAEPPPGTVTVQGFSSVYESLKGWPLVIAPCGLIIAPKGARVNSKPKNRNQHRSKATLGSQSIQKISCSASRWRWCRANPVYRRKQRKARHNRALPSRYWET